MKTGTKTGKFCYLKQKYTLFLSLDITEAWVEETARQLFMYMFYHQTVTQVIIMKLLMYIPQLTRINLPIL